MSAIVHNLALRLDMDVLFKCTVWMHKIHAAGRWLSHLCLSVSTVTLHGSLEVTFLACHQSALRNPLAFTCLRSCDRRTQQK